MRRETLFWGGILVLGGILLLLGNLGFLAVDVWKLLLPLFLIALGLWTMWGVFFAKPSAETEQVSVPLAGAGQARVRIRHGAGRLRLDDSAGPGELVAGTFVGGLDHKARREGDVLDVEMRLPFDRFPRFAFPWMLGPGSTLDWSCGLNREIPLSLDLETGASDTRIDLTNLRVTDLRLQTGASATDITLPANAGYTRVKIGSGAAAVNLRVPSGVAARIRVSAGLAGVTVDRNRFPRVGGVYQSPDYETALNKADVSIETGVGSVDVR